MYKLLYPSRVRTAPPVSVRVRTGLMLVLVCAYCSACVIAIADLSQVDKSAVMRCKFTKACDICKWRHIVVVIVDVCY